MACPMCSSRYLEVRQQTGWEWVMQHFTSRRKYRCAGCGFAFRGPDRRKDLRPEDKVRAGVGAQPKKDRVGSAGAEAPK